jgi:phospholipase C
MKGKVAILAALAFAVAPAAAYGHGKGDKDRGHGSLRQIDRFVVIYEENHSFDNLYGMWEGVDGIKNADAAHFVAGQPGRPAVSVPAAERRQPDVAFAAPATCTNTNPPFSSAFTNKPFKIDDYIKPTDKTCPAPGVFAANGVLKDSPGALAGGCTRDLVHRFYQEQYQLNGGKQNRYTTGSDAEGLTQGFYDTTQLPIYKYLHSRGAPRYAIADRFFQSAFGGSFLNHQWLIAGGVADVSGRSGQPPLGPRLQRDADELSAALSGNAGPPAEQRRAADAGLPGVEHAAVRRLRGQHDPAGQPTALLEPRAAPAPDTRDDRRPPERARHQLGLVLRRLVECGRRRRRARLDERHGPVMLGPQHAERLDVPELPGQVVPVPPPAVQLLRQLQVGHRGPHAAPPRRGGVHRPRAELAAPLPAPGGQLRQADRRENEHPGYASEHSGSSHLVELLQSLEGSRCARDTMIVVTYDEFGGQWDHVPPPGQGTTTPGPHDAHGPSTRIPALILAPGLKREFTVDDTSHDTTSIMRTIEHRFGLKPLTSRDQAVADLSSVFGAKKQRGHRGRGRRH